MKKILVTGGLGFIGSALLDFLITDYDIHVVNHLESDTSRKNFQKWSVRLGPKLHIMDILDDQKLSALIQKEQFTHIIHLAARAGVRASSKNPFIYCRTNIQGTLHLLHAVQQYSPHTRCIFASSSTVHGNPITSFYGLSKHVMEEMTELYCRQYQLNAICVRFFSVYGTDCRQDLLIGQLVTCLQEKKPLTVFGDGNIRRDFTYIEDTLQAIHKILSLSWSGYQAIDIGTGENHSVNDVIQLANSIVQQPVPVHHVDGHIEDMPISKANIEFAKQWMDFQTKTCLKTGLQKMLT